MTCSYLLGPTAYIVSAVALMKDFFLLCFFLLFFFRKSLNKEVMSSRALLLNIREESDSSFVLQFVCENFVHNMRKSFQFLSYKYIKKMWSAVYNKDSVGMRAYTFQCLIIQMCFFFTMKPLKGFHVCNKPITHWLRSFAESKYVITSETF